MTCATYRLFPFLICLLPFFVLGQTDLPIFSKVVLEKPNPKQLILLHNYGIHIDHYKQRGGNYVEIVLTNQEIKVLENLDIKHKVVRKDLQKKYREELAKLDGSFVLDCGLQNFTTGSMNGYHTYSDMVSQIELMEQLYPEITDISIIGQSFENRAIWSVKISDNVDTDESNQEGVVYYDALTHAREPISLEATLYYMWWLLENYNSDPEATYLINNREIYFVPVVNPDGYVFNEMTNPGGGGFWRKNRRASGNNCFGVDLNRNYGFGYGLNSGSSSDPCSNTYRGEGAFSEPESAAVKDFVASINPAIAFSIHTFGDVFLSPFGYADTLAEYDVYAEFVSEFIPEDYKGYGTTAKMLGYTSSGTTRDYLHSEGIYAWTPEIGSQFWEPPTNICPLSQEFLKPMKYLSWVSGPYSCFHDYQLLNEDGFWIGDTIQLDIRLKNRGLALNANDVSVELSSSYGGITPIVSAVDYGTLGQRSFASNSSTFSFKVNENAELLDEIVLDVVVKQGESISYTDKIYLTVGIQEVLFYDGAESGMDNWTVSGAGHEWEATEMDKFTGEKSFCDSDNDNYLGNSNSFITMANSIDLANTTQPFLEYNAKWSLERGVDFVTLRASLDEGLTWITLATPSQTDSPGGAEYNRNSHWIQEQVDLSLFAGSSIKFGFLLTSNSNIHGDGFYFDDFKIIDYKEGMITSNIDQELTNSVAKIFPNPNSGSFSLEVTTEIPGSARAEIYNMNGQLLSSFKMDLTAGNNNLNFNLQLAAGNYIMKLVSDNNRFRPISFIVK